MKIDLLTTRIEEMETEIATLRRWGATAQADTLEAACDHFRSIIMEWLDQPLSPGEAAEECEWEASTVAKKLRSGELPQAGQHGKPKVRRRDILGIVSQDTNTDLAVWAERMVEDG